MLGRVTRPGSRLAVAFLGPSLLVGAWATEAGAGKKEPFPAAVAPVMTLVDGGSAKAVIVGPEKPSAVELRAMGELVDYIGKITGAKLPIVREASANSLPILIGRPSTFPRHRPY